MFPGSTALKSQVRALFRCTRGATAIEYGLLIGLIAIAMVGAMTGFRDSLATVFGEVSASAVTATNDDPPPETPIN